MLVGSIYGWELGRDDIFDPLSTRNRDDCLEPMRVLRDYARGKGINLHTADVVKGLGLTPDFNLYVESIELDREAPGINCLLLLETPLTVPINGNLSYLSQFDEIFTWNLDLIGAKNQGLLGADSNQVGVTEIRVPNPVPKNYWSHLANPGFASRPYFCNLIGSNRHANLPDPRELYSHRVKAIRWFEKNAPKNFFLYGNGWKVPQKRYGRIGKLIYRLEKILPFLLRRPVFPSYQGPVANKQEILSKTRFCICFENARNISGYVTEKIFDCLLAGCIPVYWGEPNIEKWLPSDCFIDFRKFSSYDVLYEYLSQMPEEVFEKMQSSGREFLKSNLFYPHSSQAFASKIIDRIIERIC